MSRGVGGPGRAHAPVSPEPLPSPVERARELLAESLAGRAADSAAAARERVTAAFGATVRTVLDEYDQVLRGPQALAAPVRPAGPVTLDQPEGQRYMKASPLCHRTRRPRDP